MVVLPRSAGALDPSAGWDNCPLQQLCRLHSSAHDMQPLTSHRTRMPGWNMDVFRAKRMAGLPRRSKVAKAETDAANRVLAIRTQCWNAALNAYATSYIFQRRARLFRLRLQFVTYVGFVVPMIVGLLVLGYGEFKSLTIVISAAVSIGICQVAFSLWSIIGGWVDRYSYSLTSISANDLLAAKYTRLASSPPESYGELQSRYEVLQAEDDARQEQDYQQAIKEEEKHMGMRAALRKYQRRCAACNKIPTTMRATDCGVCGDFRYRIR
jgi:mobilome CxxCx(11)CxxC protein